MDREQLMNSLERLYLPKQEILSRIPLGTSIQTVWQEMVARRRSKAIPLPMRSPTGESYWFVVTDNMIAASEKIVEEAMLPYQNAGMAILEESFYTSYVEGSPMTIEEALAYVRQNSPPQDIHEQLLQNNRQAMAFAMEHLYHPMTEDLIRTLASMLTAEMDDGGGTFRAPDKHVIPFMGGEPYTVPAADAIPGMLRELVVYLLDLNIHPLLKAAVAHAWFMVVRPFSEGNERLARLVAWMILNRAKYSFFNEVSLSALIAQDGYGYYDAAANVLRENSGDLTYLVEYYISLLGKAIDEIHMRRMNHEAELGSQALDAEPPQPPYNTAAPETQQRTFEQPAGMQIPEDEDFDQEEIDQEEMFSDHTAEQALSRAGFVTMSLSQDALDEKEPENTGQLTFGELLDKLKAMAERPSEVYSAIAQRMLEFIEAGKITFSRGELTAGIADDPKKSTNVIGNLRGRGLIASEARLDTRNVLYRLNIQSRHSPEVLALANHLANSKTSPKDRRIGEMIIRKLETGHIDISDYQEIHALGKWQKDIELCLLLGLVTKETNERYRINLELQPGYNMLKNWQKSMASALFDRFGKEIFTSEMIVANLDYSETTTSATLHTFTLMGILDCAQGENKDDYNMYQFLVTPEEHPECFRDVA